MKRACAGLCVVVVAVGLVVSEAWARGPRGAARRGARSGPRSAMGRPSPGRIHTSSASSARPPANLGPRRPNAGIAAHRPPLRPSGNVRPNPLPNRRPNGTPSGANRPPRPNSARSFESLFGNRPPISQTPAARQAFDNWTSTRPEPFTPAWYRQHPRAWHATHPYADEAVAATAVTLAAWLAAPPYAVASPANVVVEETVVVEQPIVAEEPPAEMPVEEPATAEDDTEAAEPEWVNLGVYELLAPGEAAATRWMELAVARDGRVAGNYFDRALGDVDPIHGRADPESMRLWWSVGEGTAVFQTTFDELMQPEGRLSVQPAEGEPDHWRIVRREP